MDAHGTIKTLFHGVKGSRKLPKKTWIESEYKWVNDNSAGYWSGWHVLPTEEIAIQYLTRFKTRLEKLKIVPCNIKGKHWPKNDTNIILAQYIRIL